MKQELKLKIQAWLDGELSDRESHRMGAWIAGDAEAAAWLAELSQIKEVLTRNEPAPTVPDTREFYWSKIERQIQRAESQPALRRSSRAWNWQRWLMPLAGVSALVCGLVITKQTAPPTFDETSVTSGGMEAVTFHDQSSGMTVVWLQDSAPATKSAVDAHAGVREAIPDPGESEVEME